MIDSTVFCEGACSSNSGGIDLNQLPFNLSFKGVPFDDSTAPEPCIGFIVPVVVSSQELGPAYSVKQLFQRKAPIPQIFKVYELCWNESVQREPQHGFP